MLEAGTMLLFCAVLFASVALGWSIIPALFVGVLLFMGYGLVRRCSLRAMANRAAGSVRSAGTVVVAFVLIGVLTSLLGVPFFFLLILRKKRGFQDA